MINKAPSQEERYSKVGAINGILVIILFFIIAMIGILRIGFLTPLSTLFFFIIIPGIGFILGIAIISHYTPDSRYRLTHGGFVFRLRKRPIEGDEEE